MSSADTISGLIRILAQAKLALDRDGTPATALQYDWKEGGACVHLATGSGQSHHIAYLDRKKVRYGSLVVQGVAWGLGLEFLEYGAPPPTEDPVPTSLKKASTWKPYQGKGKRKGTPGNFQYEYDEDKPKRSVFFVEFEEEDEQPATLNLFDTFDASPLEPNADPKEARYTVGEKTYQHHIKIDEKKPWTDPNWAPDLDSYDRILVNTSAGKDSQAMMDRLVALAEERGIKDKLLAVHCDLGRVEWDNTLELAQEQADAYGIPLVVVRRPEDLLSQVVTRYKRLCLNYAAVEAVKAKHFPGQSPTWGEVIGLGPVIIQQTIIEATGDEVTAEKTWDSIKGKLKDKADHEAIYSRIPWPDGKSRFCTSDQKTNQVKKLVNHLHAQNDSEDFRVLNCLGIRAQESPARAKKAGFKPLGKWGRAGARKSQGKREVDQWYPIFGWPNEHVWDTIEDSKVPYAHSYDVGMGRHSCAFCVLANPWDLAIAAQHNPELFEQYLQVERDVKASFKADISLGNIAEFLAQAQTQDLSQGLKDLGLAREYLASMRSQWRTWNKKRKQKAAPPPPKELPLFGKGVFWTLKKAAFHPYHGKGKRTGAPGHYDYEYEEEWSAKKELHETEGISAGVGGLFDQALDALKERHLTAKRRLASTRKKEKRPALQAEVDRLAAKIQRATGQKKKRAKFTPRGMVEEIHFAGAAAGTQEDWPQDEHPLTPSFWAGIDVLNRHLVKPSTMRRTPLAVANAVAKEAKEGALALREKRKEAVSQHDRARAVRLESLAAQLDEFAKLGRYATGRVSLRQQKRVEGQPGLFDPPAAPLKDDKNSGQMSLFASMRLVDLCRF